MKIKDFYIGQSESIKHKLTNHDVAKFIELSGDENPIHTDKNYAAKTHFKSPIIHGMLGANFISSIIGNKLPGPGSLWLNQTLEFISPARVGDNLTITAVVKSILKLERVLTIETTITKGNGEVVTKGMATVKVLNHEPRKVLVQGFSPSKVALVIGGSGGIGSAVSKELASNDYKVVICYKENEDQANKIMKEIQSEKGICNLFKSDLSSTEEIETLISETLGLYDSISHVVFCASSPIKNVPISKLNWGDFTLHIDVNIRLVFELTKHLLPIFETKNYGNIICVGSSVTDNPPPNWLPYVTAKSSLLGLVKGMAKELGMKNIRINLISPGTIETSLTSGFSEKSKLTSIRNTPLGRLTEPDDVSNAVIFLASENSSHINGHNLVINGGA